jgi:hypothetical protein
VTEVDDVCACGPFFISTHTDESNGVGR